MCIHVYTFFTLLFLYCALHAHSRYKHLINILLHYITNVVFCGELHRKEAVMQKPEHSDKLKRAKEEAVYGMLVADAVAMPVHWYYNPDDIKRGYGSWLTGYVAPNSKHPSSILNLSAVGK